MTADDSVTRALAVADAGYARAAGAADEWPADDDDSWRAVAKRWECLYREAVGLPATEHTARRLEAMASAVEKANAELAALAACREVRTARAEGDLAQVSHNKPPPGFNPPPQSIAAQAPDPTPRRQSPGRSPRPAREEEASRQPWSGVPGQNL